MPKLKQQSLQCPFCAMTSTRGTGLSAHIRTQHASQYKKWNRDPNRLVEAAEAASAPKNEPERTRRVRAAEAPVPVKVLARSATEEQPLTASIAAELQPQSDDNSALALLERPVND